MKTDRITAAAAAHGGGLWLGTAQGLFHVDQGVLRQCFSLTCPRQPDRLNRRILATQAG